jgi:hypothetical protein
MMYSNENINLGLHHFQGSDASFQGVESVDDQAPLVYTQNNAPALSDGLFSAPDNVYIENGKLTIIDKDTGEVLTEKTPNPRAERWALKSVVNKLMPKSRTSKCHRWRIPTQKTTIYRKHDPEKPRAFYGGLEVCANVWACPVCAAKISERRREELKKAIDEAKKQGLCVSMLTLTAPHYKGDDLADLLDKMTAAQTKLWKDKAGKRLIETYGIVGRIRAFEVTYGENGFHPHFHILLFTERFFEPSSMSEAFYRVWKHCCVSKGLGEPSLKHGVRVDVADEAIGDYVAKWGLDSEMTKGHVKRSKTGYSMTDLLRAYLYTNDKQFSNLWLVFAKAFKGRRQLVWTNGLKARLLVEDQTDEELATAQVEEAVQFAELNTEQWQAIYRTNSEFYVLNCVEKNPAAFDDFLERLRKLSADMAIGSGSRGDVRKRARGRRSR